MLKEKEFSIMASFLYFYPHTVKFSLKIFSTVILMKEMTISLLACT